MVTQMSLGLPWYDFGFNLWYMVYSQTPKGEYSGLGEAIWDYCQQSIFSYEMGTYLAEQELQYGLTHDCFIHTCFAA